MNFPRDIMEQAQGARNGWEQVGRRLEVPNLSLKKFLDKLAEARLSVEKAEEMKVARARAIQERNKCLSELWDLTKRIKNAAKATFGDTSKELELLTSPSKSVEDRSEEVNKSQHQ